MVLLLLAFMPACAKKKGTASTTPTAAVQTTGYIAAFAGTNPGGAYTGDGSAATSAQLHTPKGITVDAAKNIYISDYANHVIRMVPAATANCFGVNMTAGMIYTVAGTGTAGYSGDTGLATSAKINNVEAIAADGNGDLFIADTDNHVIRMIPATSGTYFGVAMTVGHIYTIAGTGAAGTSADGTAATSAQLDSPAGVTIDGNGNLFIADTNNNLIRMVPAASGTFFGIAMTLRNIYTIAGTGSSGNTGNTGVATSATVHVNGLARDLYDNIYFADSSNGVVRMVAETAGLFFGQSTTVGNIYSIASGLTQPTSVATDGSGHIYVASTGQHAVHMVPNASATHFGISMTANTAYRIAGTGSAGYSGNGAAGTAAQVDSPASVSVDSAGNVYISDTGNNVVRKVLY